MDTDDWGQGRPHDTLVRDANGIVAAVAILFIFTGGATIGWIARSLYYHFT